MLDWFKSGGTLVLQICTDFSHTFFESSVLNDTPEAYLDLFAPLGMTLGYCDWRGQAIRKKREAKSRIVISTTKPVRHVLHRS